VGNLLIIRVNLLMSTIFHYVKLKKILKSLSNFPPIILFTHYLVKTKLKKEEWYLEKLKMVNQIFLSLHIELIISLQLLSSFHLYFSKFYSAVNFKSKSMKHK